jgi:TIGR03943 family protein
MKFRKFKKKLNLQALVEILTFFSVAIFIVYFIISKRHLQYIAPKTEPYLYFSAAVMALWGISRIRDLFSLQYKLKYNPCLIIIIPVMFVFLPHAPLSSSDFASGYLNTEVIVANQYLGNVNNNFLLSPNGNDEEPEDIDPTDERMLNPNLTGIDFATKTIMISDDEFYPWIQEVFRNYKTYEGFTMNIKGFVFKGNNEHPFAKTEFVPARMVMYCCASDMSPVGIKGVYQNTENLELDSWVEVTGKIVLRTEQNTIIPVLAIDSVKEATPPEIQYIYP